MKALLSGVQALVGTEHRDVSGSPQVAGSALGDRNFVARWCPWYRVWLCACVLGGDLN